MRDGCEVRSCADILQWRLIPALWANQVENECDPNQSRRLGSRRTVPV
jgi:hypothetical protein